MVEVGRKGEERGRGGAKVQGRARGRKGGRGGGRVQDATPESEGASNTQESYWYKDQGKDQGRAFPAALGLGNGSTTYDLSQQPVVFEDDLASVHKQDVEDAPAGSFALSWRKPPIFWWRVTAGHIAADLAPPRGPLIQEPRMETLSMEKLVQLQEQFLKRFEVPNDSKWKGRESAKERATCNSKHARSLAWARLEHLYKTQLMEAYGPIPEELLQHFRVDVYGNVVALDAVPGSPAAFSMDHIMPWSRGGLTKTENLMALSEAANLAKSDTLHCFIIQQQRRQVPQAGHQAALLASASRPASVSSGATQAGKVVNHLLIKEKKRPIMVKKDGQRQQAFKTMYFLQPMPMGLQVSELIELWQRIKGIQDRRNEGSAQGTVADPAEEEQQLQAAHKHRIELLKTLLCQPWPGMLKVRHEKNTAITADGLHSIMAHFIKVARKFATALPTIELTAQLARGEPLPDSTSDSSSTTSTVMDEESRTSGNAEVTSEDEIAEDEGEEGEDGPPSKPAPPPTLLQPQLLPPLPIGSKQRPRMPSDNGALLQSSISGTKSSPQQHPSQPAGTHPTSTLLSPSPKDPFTCPSAPPVSPLARTPQHLPGHPNSPDFAARINHSNPAQEAHQSLKTLHFASITAPLTADQSLATPIVDTVQQPPLVQPHSETRPPQNGVGLKNGLVSEPLEPTPPAVYLPSLQPQPPSRPKFWMPQPSNPYIQLPLPEHLAPDAHHLPFSNGTLLVHHPPQHSIAATPISAPAAQPHTHAGTRSGMVSHMVSPGTRMPPLSPSLGEGNDGSDAPPAHAQKAGSTWLGGWNVAFVPEHRLPPPTAHFNPAPLPPMAPVLSSPPMLPSSPAAQALPPAHAPPQSQPRKPVPRWLHSLLCLGSRSAGAGAPASVGGPNNNRSHIMPPERRHADSMAPSLLRSPVRVAPV